MLGDSEFVFDGFHPSVLLTMSVAVFPVKIEDQF